MLKSNSQLQLSSRYLPTKIKMKGVTDVCLWAWIITCQLVIAKQCTQKLKPCGEMLCCCWGKIALCENTNLTYIPKLPNGLRTLTFRGNNLENLTKETFKNVSVSSISFLGLQSNGIVNIEKDTFQKFTSLRKLSLQNNDKLNWSQLQITFGNISRSLDGLFLDNTGIKHLRDDMFDGLRDKKIQFITLRNNSIKDFNENSFYHLQYLQNLDLSGNRINRIRSGPASNGTRLGHRSIERLMLRYNEFVYFPPFFCDERIQNRSLYPRLKSLDLTGNAIMELVREAWSCLKRLDKLLLSENVIQKLSDDIFLDLKSLAVLHLSNMAKPIKKIATKAFHNMNLLELHFDNNNIDFQPDTDVSYEKVFTFCPNVKKLLLGYNYFRSIYDTKLIDMLSPLKKLTELHLEGARLYKIPENLLGKFENLTKLYLGNNKIQAIDNEAFINVTKLTVLHIEANKIKVINDTFPIALRHSLTEVNLAGNPFSCSFCTANNNTWFRNWIDSSKIKFIHWPSFYVCASPPSEHGKRFASQKPKPEDCETKDPMIVAYVTIGGFLLIFTIFGVAGYRGRWYIRYWTIKWQRKCGCSPNVDPERQRLLDGYDDVTYDAYVIYHDDDRAFVRNELLPFMETTHQYKLFIWDRDFTAGDQTVGIVVDSICKSNHSIAVVSRSFLKDQWCDFQLAVCLDRQIELKRNFLTLLTLENVDKKLLSKSWCVLLTRTLTAEWCDKKNDIRRKLFENQILSNVPCLTSNEARRYGASVNGEMND